MSGGDSKDDSSTENEKRTKTKEEILKEIKEFITKAYDLEKEQFDAAVRKAGYIGMSLTEFYNSSNKTFTNYLYGRMKRIEDQSNNDLFYMQFNAMKTAQAVWGSRSFKDKPPKMNFTDGILPKEIERKNKVRASQASTIERIERQYGVKLKPIK